MLKSAKSWKKEHLSKEFCTSVPKRWFPILTWLPQYTFEDFKGDFIAGFTVGLTVVPQGLALAHLAGLPAQYGLYTAFMGSFMYAIFGTCKDLVIGPTAVMALMTAQYVELGGPAYAVVLTFLCGCFQLLVGIFNLGFLVNFISASVLSGFTSAAAIIIATSQLKGLLGLKFSSRGFIQNVQMLFTHLPNTNLYDMSMGIFAIIALLLFRKFKDLNCFMCCNKVPSQFQYVFKTMWWSFATARNAVMVIFCSVIASVFLSSGLDVFTLTEHVDAGFPPLSLPPLTVVHAYESSNSTVYKNTFHILKDLGAGAIVIPFLSLLEAIAIAKVFSRSRKLDATREMIAVGMGNLMGSFVSAYPATGSFSRTVINNSTGVRTPLGGIFSGTVVLLALGLLAPSFHYIPKACLCAIIFSAVIFMVHYQDIPAIWKTSKLELVPFATTFVLSITLGLEFGLLFGVAVSLGMLLYKQNKPHISISVNKVGKNSTHIHVTPDSCIYFPSIDYLKGKVIKAISSIADDSEIKVVIHGDHLTGIDYSTALGIKSMIASLEKQNIAVQFKVSEPLAVKSLNCLESSLKLCHSIEELQEFSEGNSNQPSHSSEVKRNESGEPLLSKFKSVDGDDDLRVTVRVCKEKAEKPCNKTSNCKKSPKI